MAAKVAEMIQTSRPDLSVKVVAEYTAAEDDQQPYDPNTMRGYRYIFRGEETMEPVIHDSYYDAKSVVKIDQVYQWIDRQEYSDFEKDKAKDFCLAFALFKLLNWRFYGYVPAEAGSEKACDLVLDGLIHMGATGPDAALRVVEEELAFLYDFFYTRNMVLVGAKTYILIAVAVAGLTMWTAIFGTLGPGYHHLLIGAPVPNLDRSVTLLVVVITAGLEVFQAVSGFSSNWRYVKTVYRCVRDDQPWSGRRAVGPQPVVEAEHHAAGDQLLGGEGRPVRAPQAVPPPAAQPALVGDALPGGAAAAGPEAGPEEAAAARGEACRAPLAPAQPLPTQQWRRYPAKAPSAAASGVGVQASQAHRSEPGVAHRDHDLRLVLQWQPLRQ
ncbi:hypothetical protein BS78_09G197100 [Paspalum vaginatum]|nr:hypothetical protein BS78_09G197100 [Paspalum vaginatum]